MTFLSILSVLNTVVSMLSAGPQSFMSSSHFIKPSASIRITKTSRLIDPYFFSSLAISLYLYLFSLSCIFTLWSVWTAKSTTRQILFFFCGLSLGQIFSLWLGDVFISQKKPVRLIHMDRLFAVQIPLFVWSNFSFFTITSGSPSHSPVSSSTLFALIFFIHLLCFASITVLSFYSFSVN